MKNALNCPDTNYYIATTRPKQLGHRLDNLKGHSSMSGSGLGSGFAKLFCSALPLAKKHIPSVATDFASATLHDFGCGKDFKESGSQNVRSST